MGKGGPMTLRKILISEECLDEETNASNPFPPSQKKKNQLKKTCQTPPTHAHTQTNPNQAENQTKQCKANKAKTTKEYNCNLLEPGFIWFVLIFFFFFFLG